AGASVQPRDVEAVLSGLPGRVLLLADDVTEIRDTVTWVLARAAAAARGAVGVVAAMDDGAAAGGVRGAFRELRAADQALVLAPQTLGDGDAVGVPLLRGDLGPRPPGRGYLRVGTQPTVAVQVVSVTAEE